MMYGSWDIKCSVKTDSFLSFWAIFCPLILLTIQKIKILEKWKKTPRDTIILQLLITCDNHTIYGSWDLERERQNSLFWVVFCPFTPIISQKIKILKKRKNTRIYHCFTLVHHKWKSYDVWFLRYEHDRHNFLSFCTIFCPFSCAPLSSNNLENQHFEKMKKNVWSYYHFAHV